MQKVFNIFLLLIIFLLFLNCRNNQVDTSFKSCVIRILSPFGCYQEIILSNKGSGVFKQGLHSGDIMAGNVTLDSLYQTDSFYVGSEEKIKRVNDVISSLRSDTIKGKYKYDAYRFQIIINEVSHIDVYGNTVKVNEVLKEIAGSLPYAEKYCEFFGLLKESIIPDSINLHEVKDEGVENRQP